MRLYTMLFLQYDDNAPECVEYTLSLTNKPTEPKLPQTGDNFNPWLYAGLGLSALALGLLQHSGKRKKRNQRKRKNQTVTK